MAEEKKVHFIWEKTNYSGFVEKEYENSYLIVVANPSPDMEEKYTPTYLSSVEPFQTVAIFSDL